MTISIGVATCPRDATVLEELLELADKALYVAKAQGRDRVCQHDAAPATLSAGSTLRLRPRRPRAAPPSPSPQAMRRGETHPQSSSASWKALSDVVRRRANAVASPTTSRLPSR